MENFAFRKCDGVSLLFLTVVVLAFSVFQGYMTYRGVNVQGHGVQLAGAAGYASYADQLIDRGNYSLDGLQPYLKRMPLYIALVVVVKLVAGTYWSYLLIALQGSLSILSGLLINRLASRLTASSLIPCLATATFGLHVALQIEHLALRETGLYEFLIICFFYAASKPATWRIVACMTLLCIAAYYTRSTGVFLTVPLILFIALQGGRYTLRERAAIIGVSLGAIILAATPWQVYQSHVRGKFTLAPTVVGGWNQYKGNSRAFEAISPYVDHDAGDRHLDRLVGLHAALPGTQDRLAADDRDENLELMAAEEIRSDYLRFIRKSILRITTYLSPLFTPLGDGNVRLVGDKLIIDDFQGNFVRATRSPLHFANELSFFVVLFIIPLGVLGNLRYIVLPNRHRAFAAASLVFILANIAVHAMITAETRYRLILDPLFIIWAWIAVACIFKVMQQRPSGDEYADGMDQRAVYSFKGR